MEDLSLHILDIAENSLRAGAKNILIRLEENSHDQKLILTITDDGAGMDKQTASKAAHPFFSTKKGKKFGLGLPLLAQACEETGGSLKIEPLNRGTKITAEFNSSHPDMKPVGDINKTLRVLRTTHPQVEFDFEHIKDGALK